MYVKVKTPHQRSSGSSVMHEFNTSTFTTPSAVASLVSPGARQATLGRNPAGGQSDAPVNVFYLAVVRAVRLVR